MCDAQYTTSSLCGNFDLFSGTVIIMAEISHFPPPSFRGERSIFQRLLYIGHILLFFSTENTADSKPGLQRFDRKKRHEYQTTWTGFGDTGGVGLISTGLLSALPKAHKQVSTTFRIRPFDVNSRETMSDTRCTWLPACRPCKEKWR